MHVQQVQRESPVYTYSPLQESESRFRLHINKRAFLKLCTMKGSGLMPTVLAAAAAAVLACCPRAGGTSGVLGSVSSMETEVGPIGHIEVCCTTHTTPGVRRLVKSVVRGLKVRGEKGWGALWRNYIHWCKCILAGRRLVAEVVVIASFWGLDVMCCWSSFTVCLFIGGQQM